MQIRIASDPSRLGRRGMNEGAQQQRRTRVTYRIYVYLAVVVVLLLLKDNFPKTLQGKSEPMYFAFICPFSNMMSDLMFPSLFYGFPFPWSF